MIVLRLLVLAVFILIWVTNGFTTALYCLVPLGVVLFVVYALIDAGRSLAGLTERQRVELHQTNLVQHQYGDPTAPSSANSEENLIDREILPAKIELDRIRREGKP